MVDFFRQLMQGLAETWRKLSVSARVQLALALLLCLGLIAAFVTFGSKAQYVQLYSGLDLNEAGQMATQLNELGISSEMRNGGTTLLVPVQDMSRAKTSLAAQGLPTSHNDPGFEIFDTVGLTTNRQQMDINKMRAVQGRLQDHLNQLGYVRNSFVFISREPEALFRNEQKPSKATVTLDTTGDLSPAQVQAVLHIVSAYGGAQLSSNNIAITRARDGKVYHSPVEDEFAALAANKLESQVAFERERERKLESFFAASQVNARFSVSALLDWDTKSVQDHQSTDGTKIAEEIQTTVSKSSAGPPEGPAGALENIPGELGSGGTEIVSDETESVITNFEPSYTTTSTTKSVGMPTHFQVAAFIEGPYAVDEETGERGEYLGLTDDLRSQYEEMIQNAVGGPQLADVTIYDSPLSPDMPTMAALPPTGGAWQSNELAKTGINIALLVLAFIVVMIFIRSARSAPPSEEEEVIEIPEASSEELRRQEIMSEVERLSQEDPAVVASLLRTWINEEEPQ